MDNYLKRKILQLFYPSRCPICDAIIFHSDRFCSGCRDKLTEYKGNFQVKAASSFTAAFIYDENVLPAISLLKNGICGNADYALGEELADLLNSNGVSEKIDIIIPVPVHFSTKAKRTYNQSELIAKIVSDALELPICTDVIIKNRITDDQKKLNRISRTINLKNAFTVVLPELIKEKEVLLIDDICTTGSTLAELTSLMLENGAKSVHCAVCCKTPLKKTKPES